MSLIDKIKRHQQNKTANEKVGIQNLAHMLGMRQINMIERNDMSRKELVHYLVSKMSDEQIRQQLEVGKEFVCGYRPGVVQDVAVFDEAASKTRISEGNKALVKKVLVDGIPLKSLEINGQEKQIIDQGCITVCRLLASVDRYRRTTACELVAKVQASLEDPSLTMIVVSCITGVSVPSLVNHIDKESDQVPGFSIAAYMAMAKNMLDQSELREIESNIAKIRDFLLDMNLNWYLHSEGLSKKTDKIQKALGTSTSIANLSLLFEKQNKQCPPVSEIFDLAQRINEFYEDFKFNEIKEVNGVLISNFNNVKSSIESGKRTLYSVSHDFTSRSNKELTSFYNTYKRWLAKNEKIDI